MLKEVIYRTVGISHCRRGNPSLLIADDRHVHCRADIKDLEQVNNPGMIDPEYSIHIPDNKLTGSMRIVYGSSPGATTSSGQQFLP